MEAHFRTISLLTTAYYSNNCMGVYSFLSFSCGHNNNDDYHCNHHFNNKQCLLNPYVSVTVRN